MTKRQVTISALIMVLAIWVIPFAWMKYDARPIRVLKIYSLKVLNPEAVRRNIPIWVGMRFDKYEDVTGQGIKLVVCGIKSIRVTVDPAPNGCAINKESMWPVTLPEITPVGVPCRLRVTYDYPNSYNRRYLPETAESQEFVVK